MNDFCVLPKLKPESICYNIERSSKKIVTKNINLTR